jgi:hypothetical protein
MSQVKVFLKSDFLVTSVRRDLQRNYNSLLDVTHFHVNIGCHINPISFTITFGVQNEPHRFE